MRVIIGLSMLFFQYCHSDVPTFKPFDPSEAAVDKYPLKGLQPFYYLAESFKDARQKLM